MESITYDLCFNGDWVKPGSRVKFKGRWSAYTYLWILCLGDINESWIICEDSKGNRKRFKPGQLKRILGKRSYKNV